MARIRSLKPEIWLSPQVMNLSHSARLLFIGLITQADDDGRGSADVRRLKAAIFGGDDFTCAQVGQWLVEVAAQGLAIIYDGDAHGMLYQLPTWNTHQCVNRPTPSHYPRPNGSNSPPQSGTPTPGNGQAPEHSGGFDERSRNAHGALTEDSRKTHEGSDLRDRRGSINPPAYAPRARDPHPTPKTILKNRLRPNPRAGPSLGLQPLSATLETFLVEHTPDSQKLRA
jgi:hypothetical protein